MNGSCKNCKFWKQRDTEISNGTCYRRSPQVVMMERQVSDRGSQRHIKELSPMSTWPATNEKEWCGEHKVKGTL